MEGGSHERDIRHFAEGSRMRDPCARMVFLVVQRLLQKGPRVVELGNINQEKFYEHTIE